MPTSGYLLTTGLVLVLLVGQACAIRCFACASMNDPRCGDNFRLTNVEVSECPGTCYKKRGERWEGDVRHVDISRGCMVQTTEKCYNENQGNISFKVCTCNTDFCNSANHSTSLLAVIMCVFTLMYNY